MLPPSAAKPLRNFAVLYSREACVGLEVSERTGEYALSPVLSNSFMPALAIQGAISWIDQACD